jgi:hypothetical protein
LQGLDLRSKFWGEPICGANWGDQNPCQLVGLKRIKQEEGEGAIPRHCDQDRAASASVDSENLRHQSKSQPARWTPLVYESRAVNLKRKGCVGIALRWRPGENIPLGVFSFVDNDKNKYEHESVSGSPVTQERSGNRRFRRAQSRRDRKAHRALPGRFGGFQEVARERVLVFASPNWICKNFRNCAQS